MMQADLRFFADFINTELGIQYSTENYFQLEKRLTEVMRVLDIKDETVFLQKSKTAMDLKLKQLILDLATNNETSFFRDPKIFAAMENHVFSTMKDKSTIRIWCAACSFGQEPYSLLMLLSEMRRKNPAMPRIELVATDISEAALARSKAATYSTLETGRGLPPEYLTRYFTPTTEGGHTIAPDLRASISFKKQNLLESFSSLGTFDLVLCRNVLIYQKDESKKAIVSRIVNTINPGGFLILGAAESLMGLSNDFEQHFKDGTIFFQKKA